MTKSLDLLGTYESFDPSDMRSRLASLPDQGLRAWEAGLRLSLPAPYHSARKIVMSGMGGSGVGGLFIRDLLAGEDMIPPIICKDYSLPAGIGEESLVLISSYSGDTEETISVFHEAYEKGCKIICLTHGGRLMEEARQNKIPVLEIDYQGEPRTNLGYSFLAPLAILQNIGYIRPHDNEVTEGLSLLRTMTKKWSEAVPMRQNNPKQIASQLYGHTPVIYGAGFLNSAAYRWKTQLNENAKSWAFVENIPEIHHNSIAGYQFPTAPRNFFVVLLSSNQLHSRIQARIEETVSLLRDSGVPSVRVDADGKSLLAQVLYITFLGDYTSYYLAMLNKIDPSPIHIIDMLKKRLTRSGRVSLESTGDTS